MVLIKLSNCLRDFMDTRDLIALMAAWDAAETRARGIPDEELLRTYYSDTPDILMTKFTTRGAGMLIAHLNGSPVGCVGFSCANGRSAEIQKMFVIPQYRGKGIGRALMTEALTRMRQANYNRAEHGAGFIAFIEGNQWELMATGSSAQKSGQSPLAPLPRAPTPDAVP